MDNQSSPPGYGERWQVSVERALWALVSRSDRRKYSEVRLVGSKLLPLGVALFSCFVLFLVLTPFMNRVSSQWVRGTYQLAAMIVILVNIGFVVFRQEEWIMTGMLGCFGLYTFGAAGIGVYTGRTMQRGCKASRNDRPLDFWFQIAVYIGFGIICTMGAALSL